MRWLSFEQNGKATFGFVNSQDRVVDIGSVSDFDSLREALVAGQMAQLGRNHRDDPGVPLSQIAFLPPIVDSKKILCIGLNYRDHQEETGHGGEPYPTVFTRYAAVQVGHNGQLIRPHESKTLDYEGEIVLVIGKNCRRVSADNYLEYVFGFSIYNDASVRGFQRHTTQFTAGKNFMGTGGFGPWISTPDEITDLEGMELTTRLNGEVMQEAKSSQLIFGFGHLVEYCSTFVELEPGDLIVTGTPGGVGAARRPQVFMDEGDVVDVTVTPIGTLHHTITVG